MRAYIVMLDGKIFKAFAQKKQAEEYFNKLTDIANRTLIRKLTGNNVNIDLVSIPVEEDADFDAALSSVCHAGAGSSAKNFELGPCKLL